MHLHILTNTQYRHEIILYKVDNEGRCWQSARQIPGPSSNPQLPITSSILHLYLQYQAGGNNNTGSMTWNRGRTSTLQFISSLSNLLFILFLSVSFSTHCRHFLHKWFNVDPILFRLVKTMLALVSDFCPLRYCLRLCLWSSLQAEFVHTLLSMQCCKKLLR